MVEGVYGALSGDRHLVDDPQDVGGGIASLQLHMDAQSAGDAGEDRLETRDRLAADPDRAQVSPRKSRDLPTIGEPVIVVHHDEAVRSAMDVQLDAVGAEFHCPRERGERILRAFPGGASMGDDQRSFGRHEQSLTPGRCRRLIG